MRPPKLLPIGACFLLAAVAGQAQSDSSITTGQFTITVDGGAVLCAESIDDTGSMLIQSCSGKSGLDFTMTRSRSTSVVTTTVVTETHQRVKSTKRSHGIPATSVPLMVPAKSNAVKSVHPMVTTPPSPRRYGMFALDCNPHNLVREMNHGGLQGFPEDELLNDGPLSPDNSTSLGGLVSDMLRYDDSLDDEQARNLALACMAKFAKSYDSQFCSLLDPIENLISSSTAILAVKTQFMADLGDTTIPITPPMVITHNGTVIPFVTASSLPLATTITHGDTTVIVPIFHPSTKVVSGDATSSASSTSSTSSPDPCREFPSGRECDVERCMARFEEPLEITTVMPFYLPIQNRWNYATMTTSLTGAHWGTTDSIGLYYPYRLSHFVSKDQWVATAVRDILPANIDHAQPGPSCWDENTCAAVCQATPNPEQRKHHHGLSHRNRVRDILTWLSIAIGALGALLLASCCIVCVRRHAKRQGPRRSSTSLQPVVTETTTTTEKSGTLGRRAEEGRGGRAVRFGEGAGAGAAVAEAGRGSGSASGTGVGAGAGTGAGNGALATSGGTAGSAGGASGSGAGGAGGHSASNSTAAGGSGSSHAGDKVTVAPAHAQHVEAVPAHDGAFDSLRTGSETMEFGSLRGRKRSRQDGAADSN